MKVEEITKILLYFWLPTGIYHENLYGNLELFSFEIWPNVFMKKMCV